MTFINIVISLHMLRNWIITVSQLLNYHHLFQIIKDLVYIAKIYCCFILYFQLKSHSYNNSRTIRSSWPCFHSLNLSSGKWPGNRNTLPSSGDSTLLATKGLSAPKLNINYRFLQKQVECFSRLISDLSQPDKTRQFSSSSWRAVFAKSSVSNTRNACTIECETKHNVPHINRTNVPYIKPMYHLYLLSNLLSFE